MYRRNRLPLVLILILSVQVSSVAAQVVTRADSAAVLLNAAGSFQAEGDWEVAEALFHFIAQRYGDTPSGMEAQARLQLQDVEGANLSSQVELMVWSTAYGAWLGLAIPGATGANGSGAYGAGLLLGGPVGFLGGRALSRSRSLSEGQVRAITFGSLWGSWQGWGILEVMDWGDQEYCDYDVCWSDGPDGEDVLKAMVVGGLAGVATGAVLARKPIASGVATSSNFGALWGSWFGLAGGVMADLEDDKLLSSSLLMGNAGLLAGAWWGSSRNITRPRARLISIGGVIGLLGGSGLDLIFTPDNEKVAMGIPLAGSIVGLALGTAMTSDRPQSQGGGGDGGVGADGMGITGSPLLRFSKGKLSLGTPGPFPTLVPVDGPKGFSYRPALGINLLSSRF